MDAAARALPAAHTLPSYYSTDCGLPARCRATAAGALTAAAPRRWARINGVRICAGIRWVKTPRDGAYRVLFLPLRICCLFRDGCFPG